MKKSLVTLVIIGVVATAGAILYLNRQQAPPAAPVAESAPKQAEPAPPETSVVPKPEPPRTASENATETMQVPGANPTAGDLKPATPPVLHSKAVDTLISAQTGFSDRQALLRQLKKSGELDAAIAELKQRAAEVPNDAGISTALGEAIMNKFPVQDFNAAATLGLQIDQSFDAALKLDPTSWEAQFFKADAMSYWPDVAGNKGPEIIQRLSSLIDQQEKMTPQPEFARTYVLLGDQYQKAGQSAYAQSTWQLGLAKFPNDPALQKRVNNPPAQ
jgi:tetratricopeptide (TPR) repeat protein